MSTSASAVAVCETDGRVIAGSGDFARLLGAGPAGGPSVDSLPELARHLGYAELWEQFAEFVTSGRPEEPVTLRRVGGTQHVRLRRLEGSEGRPLVLVEVNAGNGAADQATLTEVGRMTSRLIHDFKNQMGGLKLYAAFLKKRFADQPEGVEISEKIINGLNVMSEHASLVTKLTKPLNLSPEPAHLAPLVEQLAVDLGPRAEAQGVRIETELETDLPALPVDAQQLRAALYTLLDRAVAASGAGGRVRVSLRRQGGAEVLEILDGGAAPDEQQLATFFDFLGGDRINKTSLDLALAKRIIELHGAQARAGAGPEGGTAVQVQFPAP